MCWCAAPVPADGIPWAAIQAARDRQARLKSVAVDWKVTTVVPKGARVAADADGLPIPRADQTVESTHRLVLDGERFRVEHNNPGFRLRLPGDPDGVWAFDGERSYHRLYFEGRDRPASLVIEREASPTRSGGPGPRPLALWCRGAWREPFGGPGGDPTAVAESDVDGVRCLEVRFRRAGDGPTTYFVDPGRGYLVRRIRSETSLTVEVTDVQYREQSGMGWVPAGWTTVKSRADGRLLARIRAEVTDVRVNEPVPPDTFRLYPIPGETVVDNDSKKTYRVRADGGMDALDLLGQPVTPAAPPECPRPAWAGRNVVRYGVLPALALFVGALVVLRRRRPPHTPSS